MNAEIEALAVASQVYKDYCQRVQRWRDTLEVAGFARDRERQAREQADAYFTHARQQDEQLRITESQTDWKRQDAL
jgi:hypothetical protein